MGWAERDYAKWTDEERDRFYDVGTAPSRATRNSVFRWGVGPAVLASGVLFAAGHFPVGHPVLPFLHFPLSTSHSSPLTIERAGTISTPGTATVGSTLTFHGTAPAGNGPVTVEGSYDGGKTWRTLTSAVSVNGSYAAQIALTQRGPLLIQIVFADGSTATGSINVE